jgi:hypothetical protein
VNVFLATSQAITAPSSWLEARDQLLVLQHKRAPAYGLVVFRSQCVLTWLAWRSSYSWLLVGLSEQEPPYEVVVLTPQKRQLRWAQSDDLKALFGLRVSNSVNK